MELDSLTVEGRYGFPLLKYIGINGDQTFYYPEMMGNVPRLIPGIPYSIVQGKHTVTLFIADEPRTMPRLLNVETRS